MGARGPAPRTNLSPGVDSFRGDLPPAPVGLSEFAAAEYERVRSIGGDVFGAADFEAICDWVDTVERERAICALINWPTATVFSERTGAEYPDPKFNVWQTLKKHKMALAAKLGFNPTDRARLLGGVEAAPVENPLLAEIKREQSTIAERASAAPAGKRPRGRPRKATV